jgi:TetR/AcrR family transcriptional regulator
MAATHSEALRTQLRGAGRARRTAVSNGLDQRRRTETIRRIVTTAERIFAEKGMDGARTDAIARAARVNKALLYYYFKSKEDLYRFTLQTLFDQMRHGVELGMTPSTSPQDRLVKYVTGYFDFMAAHPNYPRLVQREVMGRGQSLQWIVQAYFGPLYRRLTATVREGVDQGAFRRVDPQNMALTLIAMTVFYFAAAPVLGELWGSNPLAPVRVTARRRSVLDFLEHGLFRRAERAR